MNPNSNLKKTILTMLLAATSTGAIAENNYRCRVERVDDAAGSKSSAAEFVRITVGREFTVDRRTGVMNGVLKNTYATRPIVIDRGSKANSFKAIAGMTIEQGVGYGSSIYAIVVKEYEESTKKPFVFLDETTVYFGTCVHY